MNFRSKILSGYLVLTLIFSVGVLVCLQALRPVESSFDRLAVENLPVYSLIHRIQNLGILLHGEMQETFRLLMLEKTDKSRAALATELKEISRDRGLLKDDMNEYRRLVELYFPDEMEFIPELQTEVDRLIELSLDLETAVVEGSEVQDLIVKFPLEAQEEKFILVTGNIISHETREIQDRRDSVREKVSAARYQIGLAYLLSLFAALVISLLLVRRVIRPVRLLSAAVDLFRKERTVPRVDYGGADEFRDLTQAFTSMATQLNEQRAQLEGLLEQKSISLDSAELALGKQREELAEIEQQLAQMQKMEAIGTLAGGIAHDFNNILSGILGYAQMGQRKLGKDHPVYPYMQSILEGGQRAADLTRQILEFSRQSDPQLVTLRMEPVIKEAIKLLRAGLPSSIEIQFDCEPDAESAFVLGDPTQIHQIVMNLCTNAVHAMREKGGILKVELNRVNRIQVTGEGNEEGLKDFLRLTIIDTGLGIQEEDLDRIFEPYFTTKERGEGTGMGLAVVHGIVRKYQGRLRVFSEQGQGTSFVISLPLVEPGLNAQPPEVELVGGSERILLVDDDSLVRSMVEKQLVDLGYQLVCAASPYAALHEFKTSKEAYDLVITDMTMPGLSGVDLARQLLSLKPGLQVVLCTGYSEHVDETLAREIGIAAFVMKPVLPDELAVMVRALLDEGKA